MGSSIAHGQEGVDAVYQLTNQSVG